MTVLAGLLQSNWSLGQPGYKVRKAKLWKPWVMRIVQGFFSSPGFFIFSLFHHYPSSCFFDFDRVTGRLPFDHQTVHKLGHLRRMFFLQELTNPNTTERQLFQLILGVIAGISTAERLGIVIFQELLGNRPVHLSPLQKHFQSTSAGAKTFVKVGFKMYLLNLEPMTLSRCICFLEG